MLYSSLIRPLLFSFDAETIHHRILSLANVFRFSWLREALELVTRFEDMRLSTEAFGLSFKNPFGLAAGFDKDAEAIEFLGALGFGHLELGTVTAKPQPGNPKPRIFRLPEDKALINRLGFPSAGADAVREHLYKVREKKNLPILGINIGKSRDVSIDDAAKDYVASFEKLHDLVDYVAVNVSSPNTPELRKLQEPERLRSLLQSIQDRNQNQRPLLVKLSPDLDEHELVEVLDVCFSSSISGIIATNTTFSREGLTKSSTEQGGLSGAPLRDRARNVLRTLSRHTGGRLPLVGVGGIFSADDAFQTFRSGASLAQVYTGLVYEGPLLARRLKKGMIRILESRGFVSLTDVIGKDAK